jgi:uncharacterized Zn-binding protein involved in type VI secretion
MTTTKGYVARAEDPTACPQHGGGPLSTNPETPVCMEVDGRRIIRLGDSATCPMGGIDLVAGGAMHFTVCGLPVARVGDATLHGKIGSGSDHFFVGGDSFSLEGITITDGFTTQKKNELIRDLYMLSLTTTGKALLDHCKKNPVKIEYEEDPQDSSEFHGTIFYNPDFMYWTEDMQGARIGCPPFTVLGHELVHAYIPDEKDEARIVGFGRFFNTDGTLPFPSENWLRRELNLPLRGRYDGGGKADTPDDEIPRAGKCKSPC